MSEESNMINEHCIKTIEYKKLMIVSIISLEDGTIACGCADEIIHIYNVDTGEIIKTLNGHTHSSVFALTTLHDGNIASADDTINIWNVETGECIQTLNGHTDWIRFLTTLQDGNIASASRDKTIKIWNVETGECIQTLNDHSNSVWSLTTLHDGNIASGSSDMTIKMWNVETGECIHTLNGHTNYRLRPHHAPRRQYCERLRRQHHQDLECSYGRMHPDTTRTH